MSHFRSALLSLALTSAITLSPTVGAAADKANTAATQAASPSSHIRIDNFGAINAQYYRGAQPMGGDYKDLALLGVKTVIDLQADGRSDEEQLVTSAGMKFHRIKMTTHEPPTREQAALFLKIVTDPANQPVYVHCAGGRHRTGVMTAIYRMHGDGWNSDQAFKEMKQYKFGADFLHPEFKQFVYGYRVEPVSPPATLTTSAITTAPAVSR